MAEIAKFILSRLSFMNRSEVSIVDFVFKLHAVFTSRTLIVLSLFTFIKMLTTPPSCYGVDEKVIDRVTLAGYCELQDNYGIPRYSQPINQTTSKDEDATYFSYYHLTPLIMAIQSILFYLPYYTWKTTEKGNIYNLTFCFHYPIAEFKDDMLSPEDQSKRMDLIVHYLVKTWGKHRNRAFVYYICVALNFVITLGQIGLIDVAFASEFSTNSAEVYNGIMGISRVERTDRVSVIFPRTITCLFQKINPDASVSVHKAFCTLPYNYLNEKILLLSVSWFVVLTICGFVSLLFWGLLFCIPCCQSRYLGNSSNFITPNLVQGIMEKYEPSNIGDWFMLWLVCKNMNSIHYEKLLTKLSTYKMQINTGTYRDYNKEQVNQPLINGHDAFEL